MGLYAKNSILTIFCKIDRIEIINRKNRIKNRFPINSGNRFTGGIVCRMEFRNLYSFLRVSELGSFTKAAAELGYAQSTITAHIQQLEQEVGLPLFEHVGRRQITLTAYGHQLLPYVHQLLQLEKQIQTLNQTDSTKVYGTLRIGIVESIMHSSLLANLKTYNKRFPNVNVQVKSGVTAALLEMLKSGEVDIIMAMSEQPAVAGCICAGVIKTRAVFFSAQSNHLVGRENLTIQDILKEPLILTMENTLLRRSLDQFAQMRGLAVKPIIETASNSLILSLVRQEMGVSFLPEYLIKSPFFAGKVSALSVSDYELPFYIGLFYHKNKYLTPQIVGFIELIKSYWERDGVLDVKEGQDDGLGDVSAGDL